MASQWCLMMFEALFSDFLCLSLPHGGRTGFFGSTPTRRESSRLRNALSILHNIDLASAFTMSSRVGLHLFQHGAAPRSGLLPERNDVSDANMLLQMLRPLHQRETGLCGCGVAPLELRLFIPGKPSSIAQLSPIGRRPGGLPHELHSGLLSLTGISGPRTWLVRGHHISLLLAT